MATRALILRPGYFPLFDKGKPVANGYIYIGEPDLDPEIVANRKAITFLQEDGSEVAGSQPVRTSAGGVPTYNGSPVTVLIDGDYSVKVLDKHGAQVYYAPKNADLQDANIVTSVANVTELRALTGLADGQHIILLGKSAISDGSPSKYYADVSDETTAENAPYVYVLNDDTRVKLLDDFTQTGVSAVPANANVRSRRWLHIMDYMPRSEWAAIESGDIASQDPAVVTAGMEAAIAQMAATHKELRMGYGEFKINFTQLRYANDCFIDGGGAVIHKAAGVDHGLEVRDCTRLYIDKLKFVGTAAAAGSYSTGDISLLRVRDSGFVYVDRCSFTDWMIWAVLCSQMNGGVFTEGLHISESLFSDAPNYDQALQTACAFGSDGEYSSVKDSQFYRCPSAARFTDGANGAFVGNTVMQLNGGDGATLQTDRACLYAESGTNSGKLLIDGNKFNHNETSFVPIILKGDATKPQNPFTVVNNDLLVNGDGNVGYQLVMYNAPRSVVSGNKFRPKSNASGHPVVRINDSDDVMYRDNYAHNGEYHLQADNSAVRWGGNVSIGQGASILLKNNGGTVRNEVNVSFAMRISSAGAQGTPFDKPSWSCSNPAVGQYTVAHDIGNTDYIVDVQTDNSASGSSDRRYNVVRANNQFDVYVYDGSGAAVNENIAVRLTLGNNNEYGL